ncbi:MAG: DNA internalization-related competence protein ComEC/Rec2 [Acidobacteria bacterium]|nr:DNA internalization-related competence protein ComEC/Rec2 [Acidobacteriota bacterium]
MKLPLVWIVAALAAGILLAGPQPFRPAAWLALTVAALLAGLGFLRRGLLLPAFVSGLLSWVFLGAAAARLEQVATSPNHVANLVAAGRIDTSEALRWSGRLRQDPAHLPWGLRYEVDLDEVEVAGRSVAVTGGLRVNYFRGENSQTDPAPEPPPPLRAGDRVEALVRAHLPHNYGNPAAFDARAHLARENIHLTGSLRSAELLRKIAEPPPTLAHRLARVRGRLLAQLDAMFPEAPDHAAVLRAMLLGDRNFIDHRRVEAFQRSSAYHVLVIAGLHVAALATFVLWAGRRLHLSLLARTLVALAVLAAYVAVVEDRPPILRAALMTAVFLSSRMLFRRADLLNTLAVAALILLVAHPSALADPSFQLSFLTIGTIGALAVPWMDRSSGIYLRALEHLDDVTRDAAHPPRAAQFRLDARAAADWLVPRLPARLAVRAAAFITAPCRVVLRLWEIFLLSATIQLGMTPMLAYYFHRVSLAGPLANIPAVLLTGLIVPAGFLALGASLMWSVLGSAAAKVLGVLVGALIAAVEWFARWHWASYRLPGPPRLELIAFFFTVILMAIAARAARTRWQWIVAVPLALLALAIATHPWAPSLERGRLEVTVLDVGQGDSLFAAFPDGHTMLIDGGGTLGATRVGGMRTGFDIGEQVVSPYLWHRGLKRLDVVALTHAHQDHLGGLAAVLENFRVGELWVGRDVASSAFRALLEVARERGVRVVHHTRAEGFAWDGVAGQVLWPDTPDEVQTAKNNDSLVLRLVHGRVALLLPGDIEGPVERELAAEGVPLRAEFLKVAHHGSKTSTNTDWLAGVAPRLAAISVGETNPFGHPHPDLLERLRAADARVLRTDRDGAITVLSDGQTLRVHSFYPSN